MHSIHKLGGLLIFALIVGGVSAGPLVYIVNGSQFGTLDLTTGTFQQIGPNTPEGSTNLVPGPNGSLLTLTYSGNLDAINPANGVTTLIGPTGLGDCTLPTSPCGPNTSSELVGFGGIVYATDLANNLYTVDPTTGKATLIGPTGIPPLPYKLLSTNPDGSTNVYDEALFVSRGNLYATFDAITINFSTSTTHTVIPAALYRINPATGVATMIAATAQNLDSALDLGGTVYAFDVAVNQVVTLDPATGNTAFFSNYDPAVGLIEGVAATPEPASIALAGLGLGVFIFLRRRNAASTTAETCRTLDARQTSHRG
jgi:hypothetical protein